MTLDRCPYCRHPKHRGIPIATITRLRAIELWATRSLECSLATTAAECETIRWLWDHWPEPQRGEMSYVSVFLEIHNSGSRAALELVLEPRRGCALAMPPGTPIVVTGGHEPYVRAVGRVEKYVPFDKYYVELELHGRAMVDSRNIALRDDTFEANVRRRYDPRDVCPGCGERALDGKVTCGRVQCGSSTGRDR